MMFTFSVERPGLSGDIAISDMPLNLLRAGKINAVTLMLGATSAEALGFSLPILMSPEQTYTFNNFWDLVAIPALALDKIPGLTDPERISSAARVFYLGFFNVSRDTEPNFTALLSDRMFVHPAVTSAGFHLENFKQKNMTDKKIYLFHFNKESDVSNADPVLIEYGPERFLGASHADELQYLFPYRHNLPFPYIPTDSRHFNFSRMMIRLWTSFAETGVPSGAYNNVEWEPIDNKPFRWFQLDEDPQMIDTLGFRLSFWDYFNVTDIYV